MALCELIPISWGKRPHKEVIVFRNQHLIRPSHLFILFVAAIIFCSCEYDLTTSEEDAIDNTQTQDNGDTHPGTNAGSGSDSDNGSYADSDSDSNSGSYADSDPHSDSDTKTDSDTGINTDPVDSDTDKPPSNDPFSIAFLGDLETVVTYSEPMKKTFQYFCDKATSRGLGFVGTVGDLIKPHEQATESGGNEERNCIRK